MLRTVQAQQQDDPPRLQVPEVVELVAVTRRHHSEVDEVVVEPLLRQTAPGRMANNRKCARVIQAEIPPPLDKVVVPGQDEVRRSPCIGRRFELGGCFKPQILGPKCSVAVKCSSHLEAL